ILRPTGFESIGRMEKALLGAVPENIQALKADLKFVDFDSIEDYSVKHPRAARLLASIRSQGEANNIDKSSLKRLCKRTNVDIREANGRIHIDEDQVLGFLEVLDRRRYEVELVRGSPERFKAASRQKLVTN